MHEFTLHNLSCRFSASRYTRHASINDIIQCALNAADFPSQLEPLGLIGRDGERFDGITVFPFAGGRFLIWDAICLNT